MFNSIQVYNYRGIRKAEIEDLKQVNLFFGKNNCGKSSVLESIFLISGQSNPVLPVTTNNMRGFTGVNEATVALDFYKVNPNNRIKLIAEGDKRREMRIDMIKSDSHDVALGGTLILYLKRNGLTKLLPTTDCMRITVISWARQCVPLSARA